MSPNAQRHARRDRKGGFTLVEVLLVLALLALVGSVLLPAAGALFPRSDGGSPEDTVAETLQLVRRETVVSGRGLTLRYDPKSQCLVWENGTSRPLGTEARKMTVEFVRPRSGGSSVLIGGRLVETDTVPLVRFFPDGTCDPVRVQLRPAEGEARVLTIDPWTCAPGLEVKS